MEWQNNFLEGKNMLKKNILKYSKNLFDSTNYGFKFFKNGNLTILSTSFAIQLNFLLDSLKNYPIDKICANLRKQQDRKTGLFIDNDFDIKQTMGFEEEYIFWQFTYFTTIAFFVLFLSLLSETVSVFFVQPDTPSKNANTKLITTTFFII